MFHYTKINELIRNDRTLNYCTVRYKKKKRDAFFSTGCVSAIILLVQVYCLKKPVHVTGGDYDYLFYLTATLDNKQHRHSKLLSIYVVIVVLIDTRSRIPIY